ncbi:type I restriction modification protein [Paraclostridium bifermentans]|uniref:restriction endonuclease subunit S n=1 Tax=Paraclostridium bifermentans TaxID=1490 RepID=UPI00038D9243|nr:restriction endonuclease subunit S [Paraclostridium bifermentans]EQK46742.1 type I restriction modification DNA specificity domain protein [[Clostridium] bifermentans ATCC 19299] [Paraclostridium bifermentans ATCC 19299]MCE9674694.1 restriction endonuclease subunit S [Paraclostridium bifermentans]GKZ03738.1 type I restriction modification protein [Paraclostridium bifermentans]GKZ07613.1 type I restriction modification protein [Paraclostridium bifermentans]GKZ08977.1 type I restriction modif
MSFKEWKEYRLGDLIDISSSKRIYAKEYVSEGIPFYRGKEIIEKFKGNDVSTELFITEERFKELKDKFGAPQKGDILLTSVGTLGVPYLVQDEQFYFKDGNLTWFKNFNEDCYSKFIYYWLQSNYGKNQIYSKSIGSTQKALTIDMLKKFDITLPSIEEQKSIANILSTLDDKIEVNNKTNQKLEEMAQAIFKQWFIDFDFPNEEGKPYKSSGGEMVESKLGMIPKGWKVGVFRNYITDILGGDWGKEVPQGNYIKEVQCIRGADIPEINKGNEGKAPTRFILEKNFKNKQLTEGNLIVEISGGSPTQSTGRISYINDSVLNKFDKDIVCTNFCRAMTLKDRKLMEFVYIYWSYLYNLDVFFQFENGTTGIKNLDINNFLDRWDIVNPSEELINKYYEIARDLFIKIQDNGKENERLSRLRDTLLPKLMSGGIRVPTSN